jgi:hypothetical protein
LVRETCRQLSRTGPARRMTDIQFASVKDAVRWSEEISTIPDMGGGLDGLIGKTSGGRVTRQDMI